MSVESEHEESIVATANVWETVQFFVLVAMPTVAMGVTKRRRFAMRMGQALGIDRASVRWLQRIRRVRHCRALRVRVPGRTIVVLLSGREVGAALEQISIFSPDTQEKHAALAKFQPHGALISRGRFRTRMRRFNETVLQIDEPLHEQAGTVTRTADTETDELTRLALRNAQLDWDTFEDMWWKMVRTIVFGSNARQDTAIIDVLDRLRKSANWSYLSSAKRHRRDHLAVHLHDYIANAQPGSLAAHANATDPDNPDAADQVAHWLFAFDAAGMATYRALALLSSHPRQRTIATREAREHPLDQPRTLPYLRGCVEESLRLWPTTPLLLRDSTENMTWGDTAIPAGAAFVIFTPLFHRDGERATYADRFSPEIWLDGRARDEPGIVPFSAGPARCPGQNVVLLAASSVLAAFLGRVELALESAASLDPDSPLPSTFDPFGTSFAVTNVVGRAPTSTTHTS